MSAPDADVGEPRFAGAGALLVVSERRLLADLAGPPRVEEVDGWRPGLAGGPIEVLVEVVEALALAVVPPRVFAGVPVREVEALDVAVFIPNCFVGDLVGDCI